MTVQQTEIVDWLGLEKGTGCIALTIVDDLDWSNETTHLLMLQEKLNTYLAFAESGEVFDRLADTVEIEVARDTPIKVSILAKHPLPPRAEAFLEHARDVLKGAGSLIHKVIAT